MREGTIEQVLGGEADWVVVTGDCLQILPSIPAGSVGAVVTDPPYGMGKGEWDHSIPNWLPMVAGLPVATFCGVVGMRDYPTPDWVGAWVRVASTQRNGRLGGFNNWEPILFYNIAALANDTIAEPNIHDDTGHPCTKPTRLMTRLIERMPVGVVLDPFCGSGTTGVAARLLGRPFIGIEQDPHWSEVSRRRIREAEPVLFTQTTKAEQTALFERKEAGE